MYIGERVNYGKDRSGGTPKLFGRTIGVRAVQNGGQRNSQGRDMSQRIEVCRAGSIAHPQPFLTCGFEARIVTLALCTQGVCSLETEAATVNGKSVVCWNGLIFGAAPVPLAPESCTSWRSREVPWI